MEQFWTHSLIKLDNLDHLKLLVVGCLGQTRDSLVLRSNKPLDHRPFWQQLAERPTVSPEVTYGGSGRLRCFHLAQLWIPYFADTSQLLYLTSHIILRNLVIIHYFIPTSELASQIILNRHLTAY